MENRATASVSTLTVGLVRNLGKLRKRLQLYIGLAGTAVASLLQVAIKFTANPETVAALNAASGALIILVLIVNALLLLADKDSAEILAAAHEADERCNQLAMEIEDLTASSRAQEDGLKWLSILYTVSLALRDYVGPLITKPPDENTRKTRFDEMLEVVLSQKADLFGIGDEQYNFAIYLPDASGQTLRCANCRHRDRADEERAHREWPVGHGHVGRTFQAQQELIASDVQDPGMEAYFRTPDHLARDGDSIRYRSMAAVPIAIGASAARSRLAMFPADSAQKDWSTAGTPLSHCGF